MGILWIILIGLVAGLIARFLAPGPNSPSGFILTIVLGIAGSFLATFIGQAIGWYRPDQIRTLSAQSGMSGDDLIAPLSEQLPELINQLTPDGRIPTEREASRLI